MGLEPGRPLSSMWMGEGATLREGTNPEGEQTEPASFVNRILRGNTEPAQWCHRSRTILGLSRVAERSRRNFSKIRWASQLSRFHLSEAIAAPVARVSRCVIPLFMEKGRPKLGLPRYPSV